MMDVTFSKQWIHFLRSDLCPPTSTILQGTGVLQGLSAGLHRQNYCCFCQQAPLASTALSARALRAPNTW